MPVAYGSDHPALHQPQPSQSQPPQGPPQAPPQHPVGPPPGADVGPIPGTELEDSPLLEDETPQEEEVPEFPEEWKGDLQALMSLGYLRRHVTWIGGHTFDLRTMRGQELLDAANLVTPWLGTVGQEKAYQIAMVAGCLELADGEPVAFSIDKQQSDLQARFKYILENWFSPTYDFIYEKYLEMELRVSKIIEAMGKASG